MPAEVSVLVVGAGPTGLLLAAELRRRGVACRLIEANSAPLQVTLLVVRPDNHIGLRAERNYLQALGAYQSLLASG
jgi:2-polyprenyl-6-methoxyphenol hydroxylase-like FAD-dependent oxidoreductase